MRRGTRVGKRRAPLTVLNVLPGLGTGECRRSALVSSSQLTKPPVQRRTFKAPDKRTAETSSVSGPRRDHPSYGHWKSTGHRALPRQEMAWSRERLSTSHITCFSSHGRRSGSSRPRKGGCLSLTRARAPVMCSRGMRERHRAICVHAKSFREPRNADLGSSTGPAHTRCTCPKVGWLTTLADCKLNGDRG